MIPANISACYIRSGNSLNKNFDFDFIIDKPSDLIVVKWDVLSDKRTNLIYGKDYTINEFSNPNGSFIIYPLNNNEPLLSENQKLFLISAREIKQQYPFTSSDDFDMRTFEKALDYIVTLIKQIDYTLSRTVKIPYGMENEYINEFLQIFLEKVNEAKNFSNEISKFEQEFIKIKTIIDETSDIIKFGAKWVYFTENDWGQEGNNYYLQISGKSIIFDIYKKCGDGREKIFNCDTFVTDNGVKITSLEPFEGYAVVAANTIGEYVFEILTPQAEWLIEHNLGKYPSVTVVDNDGNIFFGNVQYIDLNTVKITFKKAVTGKAYLN